MAERARAADEKYEENEKKRRTEETRSRAERSERAVASAEGVSGASATCVSVERECESEASVCESRRERARGTSVRTRNADVFGGILQGASGPWWFE